jgi:tRNA(Ile)-lysidine synthase
MRVGPTKPILALRRAETRAVCAERGLPVLDDPTNADTTFRRNRVRAELVPLLDDIADRDTTPLLARAAALLAADDRFLDELASALDPTDAKGLAAAPGVLSRRAIRSWLLVDGYPPDLATVERVLDVARGGTRATDVGSGRRVERTKGTLRLTD